MRLCERCFVIVLAFYSQLFCELSAHIRLTPRLILGTAETAVASGSGCSRQPRLCMSHDKAPGPLQRDLLGFTLPSSGTRAPHDTRRLVRRQVIVPRRAVLEEQVKLETVVAHAAAKAETARHVNAVHIRNLADAELQRHVALSLLRQVDEVRFSLVPSTSL